MPPQVEATNDATALRERLQHVYWIGGGSGAGKSTVARRIAAEYGVRTYATDDVMPDHAARTEPGATPYLQAFKAMSMDERWANRSPEIMLETFHWFRGEGFNLMIEDLLGRPVDPGVIAEGFRLLPGLVEPLLAVRDHAVWLLPSPEFRLAALDNRGTAWDIPNKTSDPQRARRNLLTRDQMFTERLVAETQALGLQVINIRTGMSEDDVVTDVAAIFGL